MARLIKKSAQQLNKNVNRDIPNSRAYSHVIVQKIHRQSKPSSPSSNENVQVNRQCVSTPTLSVKTKTPQIKIKTFVAPAFANSIDHKTNKKKKPKLTTK